MTRTRNDALQAPVIHPSLRLAGVTAIGLLLLCSGCATSPYMAAGYADAELYTPLADGEAQIERGRPHKVLDTAGWIWGIPGKVILLDKRVDNHDISFETEHAIRDYLRVNELDHVKVRLNQYSPGAEWRRLFRSRHIAAPFRYTIGIFSVVGYTILPGRFFGGDNYNPYTNTINLYSDLPAIAYHEGAHAKDFARRDSTVRRGFYALIYAIPLVPLWHEAVASNDALSYMLEHEDPAILTQGYHLLYPAYGTYIGGSASDFLSWPESIVAQLAVVIPAHVVGRIKGARVGAPDTELVPATQP